LAQLLRPALPLLRGLAVQGVERLVQLPHGCLGARCMLLRSPGAVGQQTSPGAIQAPLGSYPLPAAPFLGPGRCGVCVVCVSGPAPAILEEAPPALFPRDLPWSPGCAAWAAREILASLHHNSKQALETRPFIRRTGGAVGTTVEDLIHGVG
jgi:hypothetical protein